VQSVAEQAFFELGRPRAQLPQPLIVGALVAVYTAGVVLPFHGGAGLVALAAVTGATLAITVRRYRKQLREVAGRTLNSAFNLIGQGRLREASEVLDVIALKTAKEGWVQRLVDIQQATIAIRRGEMAKAELHLSAAIDRPIEGFARENALYQLEGARAVRAFVRASLGQHDGARADIAEVTRTASSEDALARVALAEAMILEQQGKREELRLLLAEKSTLLLEHTHPRERAIVRAFQRMVRADKSSVYRRAEARRETSDGEEPMLADWVAKVAPGAASFVRSTRTADQVATIAPDQAVAMPSENALRANREAKQPKKGNAAKWLAFGVGIPAALAAGLAILDGIVAASAEAPVTVTASTASNIVWIMMLSLLALPAIYGVTRGLKALARRRAERAVRQTPRPGAPTAPTGTQLRALTESPSPIVAAQASLLLADRAERAADFGATLTAVTKGLARLADQRDRVAADIVYPDLVSLRAFALTALGRFEEANAELATLGTAYPHYGRAVFRTRLLTLVRTRNLRAAAQWIEQSEADLPLSVREELLADLVRATEQPSLAGAGEIQRLKDELQAMPEAKSWIRAAAPGLLDAFENASTGDARMRIDAPSERDPTRDQLAEEEAAAASETAAVAARFAR